VIAWACGFAAYQMVYPGTVPGWADFWIWVDQSIGFTPPTWLGSSVAAIIVGGLAMVILGRLTRRGAMDSGRGPSTDSGHGVSAGSERGHSG
jgi:nucleobase:cation symporter-1, NCS1 family